MGLSTTEKKKLTEFRKWVKTQRRKYRLNSYPKFSFGVDGRTKKILYRYSVNEIIGYDKEKDEPITVRKKLNGYTSIPLSDTGYHPGYVCIYIYIYIYAVGLRVHHAAPRSG